MEVTETLSEGLKREFKIIVPATDLEERLASRLVELKDQVRINGFRPGKVPLSHLRKIYGRSVMAEIVQQTVSETSQSALDEREMRPAFQPDIKFAESEDELEEVMQGNSDLAYTVSFEVMPDIELTDLSKIKLTREVTEIPDEDVEQAVQRLAEQNRSYTSRKSGEKAVDGDRVTIDYEGAIDGTPFEGGAGENVYLVIGSSQFIPGFEEQLIGTKADTDTKVTVTFPDDYPADHLAGKKAEFAVKVLDVAEPAAGELDDAFAQALGLESLDSLRDAVRQQIASEHASLSRRKIKRVLLDQLDKSHEVELPPTLIEQEFDSIWTQLTNDMEQSEKSFEDEGTTEDDARAEYREIAKRRVRLGLVLAEIGDKSQIKVEEEEVTRALQDQVRQFPGQEQQIYQYYKENPQAIASLRAPIFEDKVVDHILEQADVTDKTVFREELLRDPDDEPVKKKPAKKKAATKKASETKAKPKKAAAKKTPAKKTADES
jgi:trigger factor